MTAILPPYTGETARCAKCGHRGAVVGYTPDGEPCGRLSRLQAVDTVERLCRSCERCGYHWDEAVIVLEPLKEMTEYGAQIQLADFTRFLNVNGFRLLGMTGGSVYVKAIVPRESCSVAGEETVPNNQETT